LNLQPADYKSAALPLSYASLIPIDLIYSRRRKCRHATVKSTAEKSTYTYL
jgi:hypothetical protein